MSADADTDSQMLSDTSTTPSSTSPSTPPRTTTTTHQAASAHPSSSLVNLSPPDSQHRTSKMSNANGKRPLGDISNGLEDDDALFAGKNDVQQKPRQEFPTKTHAGSGYTWNSAEGEPGWAWSNKKAVDEANRAFDSLVHRECMVRGRYGDPFDMADQEKALANSLKQT